MEEKELMKLLTYGETETIEFKPTASRELAELVDLHLLEQHGITGKGTFCELRQQGAQRAQTAHKGRTKGSNEESG